MRKPRAKKAAGNWKNRRVAFMVSDAHHSIAPVTIFMPIRMREMTDNGIVYEGPISGIWADKVEPRLNITRTEYDKEYDLVGVLIASDATLEEGRITWLQQSPITEHEDGYVDES